MAMLIPNKRNLKTKVVTTERGGYFIIRWSVLLLGRHNYSQYISDNRNSKYMLTKMYEFNKRNRQFNRNREFKTPFQISLLLHDYIRRNKEYKT